VPVGERAQFGDGVGHCAALALGLGERHGHRVAVRESVGLTIRAALRVRLAERDDARAGGADRGMRAPAQATPSSRLSAMGLALEALSARDAANLGIEAEEGALVIGRVEEGSPAANAGLAPGDVVRRIGARVVRTLDEVSAALDALGEGASVPVLVERDGRARFVLIRAASDESDTRRR
jgi:membrane-associated protease RseP (regulator of RpoE activity)